MVRNFAEKLRLTAGVLGCGTQKDLCAAFRRVNPKSDFDLERSYKWVQGRSLPRSAQVYEDWAALLVIGRPAAWLASCTLGEFLDQLCAAHPRVSRTALLKRAGLDGAPVADGVVTPRLAHGHLRGAYACYSHAWSPYHRGQIVRGALVIEAAAAARERLVATYTQAIAIGGVRWRGRVLLFDRAVCIEAHAMDMGLTPLFFSLFRPMPSAVVLAGMMSGTAAVDPDAQPTATRIIMVRVPATAPAGQLEASNRYIDPAEEALSRDLAALGLPVAAPPELDAWLERLLRTGGPTAFDQMPAADFLGVVTARDRLLLADTPLAAD